MSRKKKNNPVLDKARRQFHLSSIPVVVGCLVSVVAARSNLAFGMLLLLATGGYFFWRGWRVQIVRSRNEDRDGDEPEED